MGITTFLSVLLGAVSVAAQFTRNDDGTFSCQAANKNYCTGDSLTTNIIMRCDSNGTGHPGNCNDNLAGIPPAGVKNFAPCYQSSPTAGDAACSYDGVVYPDSGPSFKIPGSSSASDSASAPASSTSPERSATQLPSVPTSHSSSSSSSSESRISPATSSQMPSPSSSVPEPSPSSGENSVTSASGSAEQRAATVSVSSGMETDSAASATGTHSATAAKSSPKPIGAIVGGVVGGIAVIAGAVVCALWLILSHRRQSDRERQEDKDEPPLRPELPGPPPPAELGGSEYRGVPIVPYAHEVATGHERMAAELPSNLPPTVVDKVEGQYSYTETHHQYPYTETHRQYPYTETVPVSST